MMLSRSIFEIELRLGLRLEKASKTVVGSTHVVEQLSLSMFPLFLTFDFDLILVIFVFFYFLGS